MYDFQQYYDLRQVGYDPNAVGKDMLRSIRTALKGYMRRIDTFGGQGSWMNLKPVVQELYYTLSKPLDMEALVKEIDKYTDQFTSFRGDNRQQDGIRLSIVHLLEELRNHIVSNTGQAY